MKQAPGVVEDGAQLQYEYIAVLLGLPTAPNIVHIV